MNNHIKEAREIVLIYSSNEKYKVTSIRGGTKHKPGDLLSKKQVESLCSTKSWSVTIK